MAGRVERSRMDARAAWARYIERKQPSAVCFAPNGSGEGGDHADEASSAQDNLVSKAPNPASPGGIASRGKDEIAKPASNPGSTEVDALAKGTGASSTTSAGSPDRSMSYGNPAKHPRDTRGNPARPPPGGKVKGVAPARSRTPTPSPSSSPSSSGDGERSRRRSAANRGRSRSPTISFPSPSGRADRGGGRSSDGMSVRFADGSSSNPGIPLVMPVLPHSRSGSPVTIPFILVSPHPGTGVQWGPQVTPIMGVPGAGPTGPGVVGVKPSTTGDTAGNNQSPPWHGGHWGSPIRSPPPDHARVQGAPPHHNPEQTTKIGEGMTGLKRSAKQGTTPTKQRWDEKATAGQAAATLAAVPGPSVHVVPASHPIPRPLSLPLRHPPPPRYPAQARGSPPQGQKAPLVSIPPTSAPGIPVRARRPLLPTPQGIARPVQTQPLQVAVPVPSRAGPIPGRGPRVFFGTAPDPSAPPIWEPNAPQNVPPGQPRSSPTLLRLQPVELSMDAMAASLASGPPSVGRLQGEATWADAHPGAWGAGTVPMVQSTHPAEGGHMP